MINKKKKLKRHLKMEDIAAAAGVSKSAVSKALNNKPDISKKMRTHILKICDEMGYQINFRIQDMIKERKTGMTYNIAFITVESKFSDPAYSQAIDGIAEGVDENDLRLLLERLKGTEQSVYDLPPILRDCRVDGFIVTGKLNVNIINVLSKLDIPYVILGTYDNTIIKDSMNILPDTEAGILELVKIMKKSGYKKIAYFTENYGSFFERKLLQYFKSALEINKLDFCRGAIYKGTGQFSGAFNKMQDIFANKELLFDSILCLNFRTALEISHLAFAHSKKFSSPLIAIGTDKISPHYDLPVPTIYYNNQFSKAAYIGVTALVNMIKGNNEITSQKILITPEISVSNIIKK